MHPDTLDSLIHGDIVLPTEIVRDAWIAVKNGTISGIFSKNQGLVAKETIDCPGHLIFPGIIDEHVHSFSYPGEGFENSTASAAAGGVTTIIEMPYDSPSPVTSPAVFDNKIELIQKSAMVDVALLATLNKNAKIADVDPLIERGACGFKLSIFETDVNRFPRIEDHILWDILPEIARSDIVVGFHAENDGIIEHLIGLYKQEGKFYPKAHVETRPPVTETSAVLKLLELAFWTKVSLHIYHVSHPRSIDLIKFYKNQGVDVTSETCPHYLILNSNDMNRLKGRAKINPCLRSEEESAAMWMRLISGDIDIIASDHAPWPMEKKESENIFENASGCPGVQTLLSLMYNEIVVKRKMSPTILSRLMSLNPAKRFRLSHKKGSISIGKDADFAIIDPNIEWTIKGSNNLSSAKWSPYENMNIRGKIVTTILRGKTIYSHNRPFQFVKGGVFLRPN